MADSEVTIYTQMIGKTFVHVEKIDDAELKFTDTFGNVYSFYHEQDCCESVHIEDICGDLSDIQDSFLIQAEEIVSGNPGDCGFPEDFFDKYGNEYDDVLSYTFTFYKFATIKGSVTVRWIGSSNGCYSERVSLQITNVPESVH